jgi:L-serine dehydratase
MSLSLFDIVGPVMIGPSSSHTAGAVRIGHLAGLIAGGKPQRVTLYFHPVLMQTYAGHRTHAALLGGLLGRREDDAGLVKALEEAHERGLSFAVEQINPPDVHQNTMRLKIRTDSSETMINGISVGGGSILITAIDDVEVELDGNTYAVIIRSDSPVATAGSEILSQYKIVRTFLGKTSDLYLTCWTVLQKVPQKALEKLQNLTSVRSVRLVDPLYPFRDVGDRDVLFTSFAQLKELSAPTSLLKAALLYESQRTGKNPAEILTAFGRILAIMRQSVDTGLTGKAQLLGGFCPGNDGLRMMKAHEAGTTISGGILAAAIARALSVMEVNGAMGLVVAAPTAGSAGVLPGVIFSIGERLGKSDDELVQALVVAAAVGICIANKASLSGAVGGCQGEVGVAAAITASAAAFLGGGDPEQCIQAAALTLKNLLGLICDPPAGPVEVPCIKRNAIGVAAALMAADMALAGIKSYIPPDEVVDALVNVQKLLPQQLKGSTIGGLGCTVTGQKMRMEWQLKLKQMS